MERVISKFDYENSTVIKPKPASVDELKRASNKAIYVISSSERNLLVYDKPSKYTIQLVSDIQDVLAIELVVSNLRFNPYNVRRNSNMICMRVGAEYKEIALNEGMYTSDDLPGNIQNKLNESFPAANFLVTFDKISFKFKFQADVSFMLMNKIENEASYPTNSICKRLGFGCKVYTALLETEKYVLTSEFASEVFSKHDTIILHIEAMQVNSGMTNVINKSYAVFHSTGYESTNRVIRKNFSPPLARINKISLTFYDEFGNLYDFQNMDHIIEFLIETYKHTRKYMVYTED